MKPKRKLLTLLFFLMTLSLAAQQQGAKLSIVGKAKMMTLPDITSVTIKLVSENKDYSKAISQLQDRAKAFKKFLKTKGVSASYLKSENFQVSKKIDYQEKKKVCRGYYASLFINLEFLHNNQLVNTLINDIGDSNTEAEITIGFRVSDNKQDSIDEQLIKLAIKDAKKKAVTISNSTDQKIDRIEKIEYGVKDNLTYQKSARFLTGSALESSPSNFAITPKEIENSTQITIYWLLKDR